MPETAEEPDDELDIDVRSVSVVWGEDDSVYVDLSGCSSPFEAIGLLRVAILSLEDTCALVDDEAEGDDD